MATDPRVDAYIAGRADFARPILVEIRARVHAACPAVEESIKWSHPSFGYQGQIMAGMAAFKAHATFGFWQRAALATGQEGEAMGQLGRLASLDDLPPADAFAAMVRDAMALIESRKGGGKGKTPRPPRTPKPEAEVPPALADALAADAAAAATFAAFAPSCRREYCEWIAGAKRDETRARRVREAIAWLREGKRRNWRYENC